MRAARSCCSVERSAGVISSVRPATYFASKSKNSRVVFTSVAGNTTSSNAGSDRWIQRGDYVRLKDVTLSYSFPKVVLDKIKIKGLRVYVSGLNLYCFNDVDFWDPEMGVTGAVLGTHPSQKSVVGGIELSF